MTQNSNECHAPRSDAIDPVNRSAGRWHRACGTDELADNTAVALPLPRPIAIYRLHGQFYATDDTCTHATFSLASGYIDEDCSVECDLHMARFCIKTGAVLQGPACIPLATYETRIDGDAVYVNDTPRDTA